MNGKRKNRATRKADSGKSHRIPIVSRKWRVNERHEELLTQEEVAALLRVSERCIVRWQYEGVLPYLQMGHTIRFHWPTVINHLLTHFMVCKFGKATPHPGPLSVRGGEGIKTQGGTA